MGLFGRIGAKSARSEGIPVNLRALPLTQLWITTPYNFRCGAAVFPPGKLTHAPGSNPGAGMISAQRITQRFPLREFNAYQLSLILH